MNSSSPESFSAWLRRVSADVIADQVVMGDRDIQDLSDLIHGWIMDAGQLRLITIAVCVKIVIDESVQRLQDSGRLEYQPNVDAILLRALEGGILVSAGVDQSDAAYSPVRVLDWESDLTCDLPPEEVTHEQL